MNHEVNGVIANSVPKHPDSRPQFHEGSIKTTLDFELAQFVLP